MHVAYHKPSKRVMARIMRQGKMHSKYFPLSEYGTRKKAESAAQRWLRKKLKELPPHIPWRDKLTSRNTSGVVGVRLARKQKVSPYDEETVYEYWYWNAKWPGCPRKDGINWSINQFDDDGAFVLAVLSRRHESIDRDAMLAEYDRIRKTSEYTRILEKKKLYLRG